MRTAVWISSIALAVAALVWLVRSRVVPTYRVSIAELPRVLTALNTSTATPAFAALMFNTPDKPGDENTVNVQFSMEAGRPGFDWVLLGPRNIADADRFLEFARAEGFSPVAKELNGVKFLRVEAGDLSALCVDVLTKMYGVPKSEELDLIVEGFQWHNRDIS